MNTELKRQLKKEIPSFVSVGNISIDIETFIHFWASQKNNRTIEKLPAKADIYLWNTGHTAFRPSFCLACVQTGINQFTGKVYKSYNGIYEIWKRNDGWGVQVFYYSSIENYNNYKIDTKPPYSIEREQGL